MMAMGKASLSSAIARAVMAVVAVAVVASGCSGSSDRPTLSANPAQDAINATASAGPATFKGTVTDTAGHTNPISGSWSGSLAAANGAQATGGVATTVSVGTAPPAPIEMRWTGGNLYLKRVVAPNATEANAGPVSIFARDATDRPWTSLGADTAAGALLLRPFNPAALLQQMSNAGAAVAGTGTVNGASVTDIRTTKPLAVMGWWSTVTADVFVDSHHRVVRVKLTSPIGGVQYDVTYGKRAAIQPPPTDQLAVATAASQTVNLVEPYTVATSGTTNGVTWKLERAKGENGTICWHFDATPPLAQVITNRPDGARCIAPPAAGDAPEDTVQFPVDGKDSGSYDALAVSLPAGAKALTLGFVGGKTQPETPTPLFVWVGPSSPTPAYFGVTLADGTKIDCGAGAVSSVSDLTDDTLTARAAGAPWACLPANS
jgi:hypothetical protein